jgi:hypothetical protein
VLPPASRSPPFVQGMGEASLSLIVRSLTGFAFVIFSIPPIG